MNRLIIPLFALLAACDQTAPEAAVATAQESASPEHLRVQVIQRYPHDPNAFTQGLVYANGVLFESTGLYNQSSLRQVDIETGQVERYHPLESSLFGEGLALADGRLIQLTWQAGIAFIFDAESFNPLGTFSFTGEGWGLCHDGVRLIMSDGSDHLHFRDSETFALLSSVTVTQDGIAQENLNELEYAEGSVFANVWQEDRILQIDPASGVVTAEIDAAGLLTSGERQSSDVLNGIAWNPDEEVFYLTGKLWPWLFEVRFVPTEPSRVHSTWPTVASQPSPEL